MTLDEKKEKEFEEVGLDKDDHLKTDYFYIPNIKLKKYVLIIGNGISRQDSRAKKFIKEWQYETWICNRAYVEHKDFARITRVTGHLDVMEDAYHFGKEHNLEYNIYLGSRAKGTSLRILQECPGIKFWITTLNQDSGTLMVVNALHEEYDGVFCVGFDLGGRDIHSPNQPTLNKQNWVKRWRHINYKYGLQNVIFVGKNHKSFIKSKLPADLYFKIYNKYDKA